MQSIDRVVRWGDVDLAGLVFYPRFLEYCHEALEALFAPLEGGYARLTMHRRIGVPTVHLEVDFRAPLRFGDTCRIETRVAKLGRTSVTFVHRLLDARDARLCVEVTQVVVLTDLAAVVAVEIPHDVRALLEAHVGA